MVKHALKLSTMVGENFEIYFSQMAKNYFKLSKMVAKKLKFTRFKWLKNKRNMHTMVGENFEIYLFQITKNALKLSTMVG